MEANKKSINDIFNGNRVLEIPFFQRAYVWEEPQWERLLEDMESVSETRKPYFMGSIILKQQHTPTEHQVGDRRTLIDGQQRLTSLGILFKVLCLRTNQNNTFGRIFRLLLNNQISLLHNHNDEVSFNRIMNLDSEEDIEGDDLLTEVYRYFRAKIDPERLDIQSILTNIVFVGIDLGVDEDEQQIFDTINSLGVRLTTAELLKNYFFNRVNRVEYDRMWKEVFEKDKETKDFWDKDITAGRSIRENIDLFFYSFLQIKIQDPVIKVSTEDKKIFTKVEGLFESYKKFIRDYSIDKSLLIQEIKEYAEIYRKFINFDVINSELTNESGIDRINAIIFSLENTTIIPYVLFILKKVPNADERKRIFGYLESYLMRRMVCHETTKNYNQLFSERLILNNVMSFEELRSQIVDQTGKINYMPTDSDLEEGFKTSRLSNIQTRGILYFIESAIRDRTLHSTSLLGLDYYSLEHIMPKKWRNNWSTLTSEEDKVKRDRVLLTLGNLTIIPSSLNTSIRDASWTIKVSGKGDKHGLRHYSAGIEIFSNYSDEPQWNESVIEKRASFLYEKAKSIWKI